MTRTFLVLAVLLAGFGAANADDCKLAGVGGTITAVTPQLLTFRDEAGVTITWPGVRFHAFKGEIVEVGSDCRIYRVAPPTPHRLAGS